MNTPLACLSKRDDHAGANSAVVDASYAAVSTRQAGLDGVHGLLDDEAGSGVGLDLESTEWPFAGMSCHTPVALQHRDVERPAVRSAAAAVEAKHYSEVAGDSAWETLRHEKHMERWSDSSGSTTTYDTSFIKHVGDRLFDTLAK